ncbi:MAG: thiosulfate oxidation carrier complex protein SoxZ [Methylobacter sp.]|nr:thiosulfate oxidation carrier complex protein SoxZ [Methylobacter sp.]MDP2097173.1 thiosulfate oxidation carrier complex protein SoxZ [Methylobacter sp.]MDP2429584.1 thiosulfate oxidation carrier complex protein SoxZ [Methylobacter sp.]MDP3054128.1 thiosulfate oxidation carrier complex protein SoxZ [Methylobacter sp.]MDP3363873.1 thiosulfate oxidation carrier complex protein SoxZ [Methylobacter sp.]
MSSIKIRTKRTDGKMQLRMLIAHPMEHGRNRDSKTNALIPAHFIQKLTVKHNNTVIMSGNIGANIAKDPYFSFLLKGGDVGDKISISWLDNLGNRDSQEYIVK